MIHLLDRRLLFVSGKGGTGKSTVSAALAGLAVARGKRVLVCEMDAKGALAAAFEVPPLAFIPTEVEPNLFAMVMNTEDSLHEYLRLFVRLPFAGRLGPLSRTLDFVASAAPGVREILGVGKLCHEVREEHYDLVVVDAEASGHVVAQLDAPRVIEDLVHVGMVREQTGWMLDILGDPERTGLVVVTTPEETPVVETLDLVTRVRARTTVDVAAVVVNRVLPQWFTDADERVLAAVVGSGGRDLLVEEIGAGVDTVLQAAALAAGRRRSVVTALSSLRAGLASDVPLVLLPELFVRAGGRRVVSLLAEALEAELD